MQSRSSSALALCIVAASFAFTCAANAQKARPFPPVSVAIENEITIDPALGKVLQDLRKAAAARDREAILKHADRGFFWDRDFGGMYDAKKSARENLSAALNIGGNIRPEYVDEVWGNVQRLFGARAASRWKPGSPIVCLPGRARAFGKGAAARLAKRINGEGAHEWLYAYGVPVDVRARRDGAGASVGRIVNSAVKLLEPNGDMFGKRFVRVALPDGRTGYASRIDLHAFLGAQVCFVKRKQGWRIVGYSGGGD